MTTPLIGEALQRSVIVTGAGSGIGRSVAAGLATDGWAVAAVDRDGDALTDSVRSIAAGGGRITPVIGDVADRQTHRRARAAAVGMAPLGASVGCAGITRIHDLTALEEGAARELVDVNQFGLLWGAAEAVAEWTSTGTPGTLVVISSVHAQHAFPDHAVYEMTKAAAEALVRSVAVSYGPQRIRAVAVAPGAVLTNAMRASLSSAVDPAAARRHLEIQTPAERLGEPDEIASVVSFLLSDSASYISGTSITIDGGWSAVLSREPTDPQAHRVGE